MGQSVYISMPYDRCDREDMEFFASVEALWRDFDSRVRWSNVNREEFIRAVEDTEIVVVNSHVWYKDQMEE